MRFYLLSVCLESDYLYVHVTVSSWASTDRFYVRAVHVRAK